MSDKNIDIGVDTSKLGDGFNKIRQSAESLAREIISSSRAYSTSSKEVTRDIEEQIRAIERRNKLDKEFYESSLRQRHAAGEISETTLKSRIASGKVESDQDRLQTQLLREIIDTIKGTAQAEIREGRVDVEKTIAASKTVGILAPKGDEAQILKETIQRGALGDVGQQEIAEAGRFKASHAGISLMQRTLQSSNIYEAGLGLGMDASRGLGMTKFAAAALPLSLIFGAGAKAVQAGIPYSRALGQNVSIFGGNIDDYESSLGQFSLANLFGGGQGTGFGRSFTDLGVNITDATQRRAMMARAAGGSTFGTALSSFQLEKGAGLDFGMVSQLERTSRGGGMSSMAQTGMMINALTRTGAIQNGNLSLLPEYLQTLVSISQEQLATLGEVDKGVNIKMIAGISNLDESFKNPDVLKGVVSSLRGGLTSAQSPQVEALQYATLSKMNPGASLFELQKMRENPFSAENKEYLPKYLEQIRAVSGGSDEMFYMNIASAFGTSATMAEKIGKGFAGGKLQDVLGAGIGTEAGVAGRAQAATSEVDVSIAKFSSAFMQSGRDMVNATNLMKENISAILTEMGETMSDMRDIVEVEVSGSKIRMEKMSEMLFGIFKNSGMIMGRL